MRIEASKEGGLWHATVAAGLGAESLAFSRSAPTRAEAVRLATEAYEDATAPLKTCRAPEHEGDPRLPATLRYFSRQGKRVLADGTPLLRSRCRVCFAREQAELYQARKAKRTTTVKDLLPCSNP